MSKNAEKFATNVAFVLFKSHSKSILLNESEDMHMRGSINSKYIRQYWCVKNKLQTGGAGRGGISINVIIYWLYRAT